MNRVIGIAKDLMNRYEMERHDDGGDEEDGVIKLKRSETTEGP